MLSAPLVLQTLYLHYFPLRDLIAFYLTLDISCEIQWLNFQCECIHCFCGRVARANSTLQTWIQKPSHMSRYCCKWKWEECFIMQIISRVSGFQRTHSYEEGVSLREKLTNMVHHPIFKNLIITPDFLACTCWHLFEQYIPWLAPWGLGFVSHMYCLVFLCTQAHTQADKYYSGNYPQYEKETRGCPLFSAQCAAC